MVAKFDQCELLAVVDVARDLRVDFLKLAPSRDFETSSRGQKTIGSHLKWLHKIQPLVPFLVALNIGI